MQALKLSVFALLAATGLCVPLSARQSGDQGNCEAGQVEILFHSNHPVLGCINLDGQSVNIIDTLQPGQKPEDFNGDEVELNGNGALFQNHGQEGNFCVIPSANGNFFVNDAKNMLLDQELGVDQITATTIQCFIPGPIQG